MKKVTNSKDEELFHSLDAFEAGDIIISFDK